MSHTNSVIKGEFYSLAQGTKIKELPHEGKIYSYYKDDDIFQRLLPIIPKVTYFLNVALFFSSFCFVELFSTNRRYYAKRCEGKSANRIQFVFKIPGSEL